MGNKEAFLNRIAEKLGRSRLADINKPVWPRHPSDQTLQKETQDQLASQFEQELTKLGGQVIRVESLDTLPTAIHSWLRAVDVQNIVSWKHTSPCGISMLDALQQYKPEPADDSSRFNLTVWDEDSEQGDLWQATRQADVGFTIAEHGIAETGSIVLYNRGAAGRSVSLLPTRSASILQAKDIVPRITQVFAQLDTRVNQYSCINVITGPSRSADIEMDLSIGVHGPGQLVVFLVENE